MFVVVVVVVVVVAVVAVVAVAVVVAVVVVVVFVVVVVILFTPIDVFVLIALLEFRQPLFVCLFKSSHNWLNICPATEDK